MEIIFVRRLFRYIYAIIAIEHAFPRAKLKTSGCALKFQHLPQNPANVNARKNMFDPYNEKSRHEMLGNLTKAGVGTEIV